MSPLHQALSWTLRSAGVLDTSKLGRSVLGGLALSSRDMVLAVLLLAAASLRVRPQCPCAVDEANPGRQGRPDKVCSNSAAGMCVAQTRMWLRAEPDQGRDAGLRVQDAPGVRAFPDQRQHRERWLEDRDPQFPGREACPHRQDAARCLSNNVLDVLHASMHTCAAGGGVWLFICLCGRYA